MVKLCIQEVPHVIIHVNNVGTILDWQLMHKPVSGSSSTIAGHQGHPSAFAHTRDPTVNLQVDHKIPIFAHNVQNAINIIFLQVLNLGS